MLRTIALDRRLGERQPCVDSWGRYAIVGW